MLVRQHHRDGWMRGVVVERAASGDQLHQSRAAVVVANVERKQQAILPGVCLADKGVWGTCRFSANSG